MGQKCLNGDQGNPIRRRDSETRKWGQEILSHIQRSPAGSSAGGRGGGSRLELCRRWKRELKQGPPTSRIECLMNWGGADEIIEISVWSLSHVQHFVTLLTVATRLLSPLNSSGKNTGVGCHFLLQETFPTQGLNPGLPHCRQTLYQQSHQGTEIEIECTVNELCLTHPKTFPHPCLSKKIVFQKNSRGQGRNFKCTQLSQVAGLGRCWSSGVPRGRPSLVWGPQKTSESLGDDRRDLFHFF